MVGGNLREKFHRQVSCEWISQASGDRVDGEEDGCGTAAHTKLDKEDDIRESAL